MIGFGEASIGIALEGVQKAFLPFPISGGRQFENGPAANKHLLPGNLAQWFVVSPTEERAPKEISC